MIGMNIDENGRAFESRQKGDDLTYWIKGQHLTDHGEWKKTIHESIRSMKEFLRISDGDLNMIETVARHSVIAEAFYWACVSWNADEDGFIDYDTSIMIPSTKAVYDVLKQIVKEYQENYTFDADFLSALFN